MASTKSHQLSLLHHPKTPRSFLPTLLIAMCLVGLPFGVILGFPAVEKRLSPYKQSYSRVSAKSATSQQGRGDDDEGSELHSHRNTPVHGKEGIDAHTRNLLHAKRRATRRHRQDLTGAATTSKIRRHNYARKLDNSEDDNYAENPTIFDGLSRLAESSFPSSTAFGTGSILSSSTASSNFLSQLSSTGTKFGDNVGGDVRSTFHHFQKHRHVTHRHHRRVATICSSDSMGNNHIETRTVLLKLFNSTHGKGWTNQAGWDEASDHYCNWFGVKCTDECYVRRLDLPQNSLHGSLPSELGDLANLTHLWLPANLLSSTIPTEVARLTNLKMLVLYGNKLSGTVSSSAFGRMSKLEALALCWNNLSGPIPSELGALTSLTTLHLCRNQLSAEIPQEIGRLTNLIDLQLGTNSLIGRLPSSIENLTKLKGLWLMRNSLSGSIPEGIVHLTELMNLDLSHNSLSGTIHNLNALTALKSLHLAGNSFSGTISTSLGRMTNLTYLILFNNTLSKTIPSEIGQLSNLLRLELYSNLFNKEIPSHLGNLVNLTHLTLRDNSLSGTIVEELQHLTNLIYLDLGGNSINGSIPSWIGALTKLEILGLYNNKLSMSIPIEIGKLTRLKRLYLQVNTLVGKIDSLLNLTQLEHLGLEENMLSGQISEDIGMLTSLERFWAFSNSLNSSIPEALGELRDLTVLELQSNDLSGLIPSSLSKLSKLYHLDVSFNILRGTIPVEVGQLTNLTSLRFENNSLTGPIPSSMGNLTNITHFVMGGNNLTGIIPMQIMQLTDMTELSLHSNHLRGPLPLSIRNLGELTRLSLFDNMLTGIISSDLGSLTNLEYVHLERNNLSGSVPEEISRLQNLIELTLQDNMIDDVIPLEVATLSALEVLNLSGNKLSGSLASEMGQLKALRELVLSNNGLTGTIPNSVGNITSLTILDLSNNGFRGKMPHSLAELSLLSELILSQNQLDGPVLSEFGNLIRLRRLYLNNNLLTGHLPAEIGHMAFLEELNLSHNKRTVNLDDFAIRDAVRSLEGSIPATFGSLAYLRSLDLSGCAFTSKVPNELGNLLMLQKLDLSNNDLSGKIPFETGRISSLQTFMVRGNLRLEPLAPLSVCDIDGFDLRYDDTWCPRERSVLKLFYDATSGATWSRKGSGETLWIDEYHSHCHWHGVTCDSMTGSVAKIDLTSNALSGTIHSKLADLTHLEWLMLNDNLLRGTLPTAFDKLQNLRGLLVSGNILTGTIPKTFASLKKLLHVHLHNNRFAGDAPDIEIQSNGTGGQGTFVLDCGSPYYYAEGPLKCDSCTVCCNSLEQCESKPKEKWSLYSKTLVFLAVILAWSCYVYVNAFLLRKRCAWLRVNMAANELCGTQSLYSFLLTRGVGQWLISLGIAVVQCLIFGLFLSAAELENDGSDWKYTMRCPPNSIYCENDDEKTGKGWAVFALVMFVNLMPDIVNGMKLIWLAGTCVRFRCFVGGTVLVTIASFTVWTSVFYNVAIATSDTDLVVNAVILLFVNDMDEKFFLVLKLVFPNWVRTSSEEANAYSSSLLEAKNEAEKSHENDDVLELAGGSAGTGNPAVEDGSTSTRGNHELVSDIASQAPEAILDNRTQGNASVEEPASGVVTTSTPSEGQVQEQQRSEEAEHELNRSFVLTSILCGDIVTDNDAILSDGGSGTSEPMSMAAAPISKSVSLPYSLYLLAGGTRSEAGAADSERFIGQSPSKDRIEKGTDLLPIVKSLQTKIEKETRRSNDLETKVAKIEKELETKVATMEKLIHALTSTLPENKENTE